MGARGDWEAGGECSGGSFLRVKTNIITDSYVPNQTKRPHTHTHTHTHWHIIAHGSAPNNYNKVSQSVSQSVCLFVYSRLCLNLGHMRNVPQTHVHMRNVPQTQVHMGNVAQTQVLMENVPQTQVLMLDSDLDLHICWRVF